MALCKKILSMNNESETDVKKPLCFILILML